MDLSIIDHATFFGFLLAVIGVSLWVSRGKKEESQDYFLAGRKLTWWLIGFSLIASNISTEQFVGMSGAGFGSMGLAVASWEWMAAVSLVLVAIFLLPVYLRLGVYTTPEFLEHIYGPGTRTVLALYVVVLHTAVGLSAILYSGAITLETLFGIDHTAGIWVIGIVAGMYTMYGGLTAVVWTDLLQGIVLILGGIMVLVFGLIEVGGIGVFLEVSGDKLHTVLPADDPNIPWTSLIFAMWILNIGYWGTNQPIIQRALGARSLAEGQKGIIFAALLKLFMPFIVIVPGIIAYQLYQDDISLNDQAYAVLVKNVLPEGLRGLFFAALFGAIMSSLDSGLNSISTIFTIDFYKRFYKPDAKGRDLIKIGRTTTVVATIAACLIAPLPAKFEGVFYYIQILAGFTAPGIVATFLFGLVSRRSPDIAGMAGLLTSIPIYAFFRWVFPEMSFINQQGIVLVFCVATLWLLTNLFPRKTDRVYVDAHVVPMERSPVLISGGILVMVLTLLLYLYFW